MKLSALDLETEAKHNYPQEYALQPWRYQESKARISLMAICVNGQSILTNNPVKMQQTLTALAGQYVVTWNGVFDVAWLIAYGWWEEVKAIKWLDGMLLWKWLFNVADEERHMSRTLADAAKSFCRDEPWYPKFKKIKKVDDVHAQNDTYWQVRAKLDVIVTEIVCQKIINVLTTRQLHSAFIEARCIPEVARSWLIGVPMNFQLIDKITPAITEEMAEIEYQLGVHNHQNDPVTRLGTNGWTPSVILRSVKELRKLLYSEWQLTPEFFSEKTKLPSTDKTALTYLSDHDDRCIEILRWRELNTQLTKFIQTPLKARDYLDSKTMHPTPRLFSTYTGRMTYTSKIQKKYPVGMALHQWPRNKAMRALIIPPKGYKHVEYDASGQESRLMAHFSGDYAMRDIFATKMKFHAYTASQIVGMDYAEFMSSYNDGDERFAGDRGYYYLGKVVNLSSNYRIGKKKMRINARVQYGLDVDKNEVEQWQQAFHSSYPAVKTYWRNAIAKANEYCYAESLAGRQVQLLSMDEETRWQRESTAINHPIQGTGADMKELALVLMAEQYPEFIFWFDLHDGLHYLVREETPNEQLLAARAMLNNINYERYWGITPDVPLTWDVSVGENWSTLQEL